MNELRWTELASHVVAWHNRLPLARHIGVQHVHSLGYVMLPFVDAKLAAGPSSAPGAAKSARAAAGGQEPLPAEAMAGSLRERAMVRAQLEARSAAAQTEDSPPRPAEPARLRPAFDEDFLPPYSLKAVRRWSARQAVAQSTPRGDAQVRKLKAEAGLDDADLFPRWVLTAQIEVGRARTRVLVGHGNRPSVLGQRLISPARTMALFALGGVLAGVAGWVVDREPAAAVAVGAATPAAASAPASASAPAPPLASASASASASAATPATALTSASTPAPASAAASAAAAASSAAERPVDVEPRLGKVDLPSLGVRVDERRRRAQAGAASAAAPQVSAPATPASAPPSAPPHHAMATAPPGPSFAVATRLMRTRSESEQVAVAMRALLSKQAGPPVQVEALPVGEDWRVVSWPYLDRAHADQARALLASRGMKVQVVDF